MICSELKITINMKAEINNESKAKFFAQYWGQSVFINPILSTEPVNNVYIFDHIDPEDIDDEYLKLTPLSEITDEDAIACGYDLDSNSDSFTYGFSPSGCFLDSLDQLVDVESFLPISSSDYLRSKGYALPWMGLSIKELIEAGWVKLKSK